MIDRQKSKPGRSGERGAALVVAIAIMTILLALALTFYAISRNEVNSADNIRHQVQNDLHLEGVLAKVQSELNRNFLKYPNATSYDQAPFTIYDGRWTVGKSWALRNDPILGRVPLQGIDTDGDLLPDVPGVPLIDLRNQPEITFTTDGVVEELFNGPRSRDWLTIPRYEGGVPYAYGPVTGVGFNLFNLSDRGLPGQPLRPPFVTPAFYGPSETRNELAGLDTRLEGEVERYPLEWIDTWADVDNDGDKLKDAIWVPIAQERLFSGGDIVDEVTGRRMFADGIDNDLDGMIDENQEDNLDYDGDGVLGGNDPDEQLEIGSFVYYGGDDGLDNDGDGAVDEVDEDKLFLAASLPELIIPLDFNADGKVPDFVPNAAGDRLVMITVTLPATINVQTDTGVEPLTIADVDAIDNDYDMLINDYYVYAFVGPNPLAGPPFRLQGFELSGDTYPPTHTWAGLPTILALENISADNAAEESFTTAKLKSYEWINSSVFSATPTVLPATGTYYLQNPASAPIPLTYTDFEPYIRITHSGEPVSDLAGRAAITIRDEAGKLNVNATGAHNYDPLADDTLRSLGEGATTAEIETRNLPDVGLIRSRDLWTFRTGGPEGALVPGFEADTALPGYGRVDDNANALISAFNRKDDDGDGLIDEGIYLPSLTAMAERFLAGTSLPGDNAADAAAELNSTRYREYFNQLGAFEGVDEAAELQRFNPLPNLVAEGNNPFNVSGVIDNLDNDLDGVFNERGELGDLQLQDPLQIGEVSDYGTAVRRERLLPLTTTFSTDRNVNFVSGREGVRAINKLDYNFATPVQIAANLLLANPFESVTARTAQFPNVTTRAFAEGLRQGDVHIRSSIGDRLLGGTVNFFAADPVLQTMQAAVDIVDNRDRDHVRSLLTSEKTKIAASAVGGYDYFPDRLSMRERISDGDLLPLGELQDHLRDQMAITRKLEVRDDWWTFEAGVRGFNDLPEVREISYTTSGNEAIKINEIMVRAVRRVEAEAIPDDGLVGASDPMVDVLPANYNFFDPTPEADKPAGQNVLPDFTVIRETLANSNWTPNLPSTFLGENAWLQTTGLNIDEGPGPVESIEDIIQFRIFPTNPYDPDPALPDVVRPRPDGLPSGRYYLTVKATINGLPVGNNQLEYSIRYLDYTVPTPTILNDVSAAAAAGTANSNHFPERWIAVPGAHVATEIGQPTGWVFINGTPPANAPFLGPDSNYFLDGGLDHDVPSTGLADGTFTVSVPEFTSTDPDGDGISQALADSNGDGLPDKALCIAFRLSTAMADTDILRIDALDFSQEPDHEWLELVNTSDEEVNVGDWNLEVGIPDQPGVTKDPFKSRWQIPTNTVVSPGGMLLLSFNKYDHYRALGGVSLQNPDPNRVADNGMGLAAGDYLFHTQNLTNTNVTVPNIRDLSNIPGLTPAGLYDPTGSVFERLIDASTNFLDYVDRDGDGRSSIYAPGFDTDSAGLEGQTRSTSEQGSIFTGAGENVPWDRIVQLRCLQYATVDPTQVVSGTITLNDIDTLENVARMVLQGGVFPNYPEQDGFDNDGDGAYVILEDLDGLPPLDPVYMPGILDRDMVDNNRNDYIDERGTAQDFDLDDDFDYFGLAAGSRGDGVNQFLSEGVDEGAGVGAGEYLFGAQDLVFYNDRSQYPSDADYDIFDSDTPVFALSENPADGSTGIDAIAAGALVSNPNGITDPYIGSDLDPADWKAFVERRWYPGDNVIVTLYNKTVSEDNVVDRVTYREQDITNRTIDDVARWDSFYPVGTDWNPEYPTFWRPNHMGLDFYRSIERKHPFYNGDRFGTTNRWEATDGNYDDWSESLSFYESEIFSDDPGNPVRLAGFQLADDRTRFPASTNVAAQPRNLRLFGHAIWGTPLRMNTAARKSENPADLELVGTLPPTDDRRQFPNPLDYFRTHEDGAYDATPATPPVNAIRVPGNNNKSKSLPNQSWNHSRTTVANRSYQSPGDLMRVPHHVYLHDAVRTDRNTDVNGRGFLRDMTLLNYGLQGDTGIGDGLSYIQDVALRGTSLGQDTVGDQFAPNILTASIGSMALESVVLTMGQAEFRPILPSAADVGAAPALLQWLPNPDVNSLLAPAAWAPVFLFGLDRDTDPDVGDDHFPNYPPYVNGSYAGGSPGAVTFDLNYLFNSNYLGDTGNFGGVDVYNNDPTDRWSLEQRTAMFVSENRDTSPAAAEALFVWDSADGLENGEYVVYIGTYVPGMRADIEAAATSAAGVVNSPGPINMVAKNTPGLLSPVDGAGDSTTHTLEDGTTLVLPNGNPVAVSPVTRSVLLRDPSSPGRISRYFDPVLAIDVITDPSEARGQAPPAGGASKPAGLIDPAEWNPPVQYRPGPDGYIFYGNNAAGGWKPQIVRVTDNFLALRVRNVGAPGQVAALTHVVLAPRKRTAGRVNVNTAQSRVVPIGGRQEYYSTLLGLPGVVDVASTVQPGNANSVLAGRIPSRLSDPPFPAGTEYVSLMVNGTPPPINTLTNLTPWTPPGEPPTFPAQFFLGGEPAVPERNRFNEILGTDTDLLVPAPGVIPVPNSDMIGPDDNIEHPIGAFRMNAALMGGRTEHADGRYYTSVGALAADSSAFDYNYGTSRADIPDLTGFGTDGVEDYAIYPLSNEADPAKRFDEVKARFSRLGNLVTTRSDVFEIIMTVESGYGVDANLDGFLNYRDPKEFVTRASTKATAVYERRAPSDTSDGAE